MIRSHVQRKSGSDHQKNGRFFEFWEGKMTHKNLLMRALTLLGLVLSLIGTMMAVPDRAALAAAAITFTGGELLGKPTDTSITINIVPDTTIEYHYQYRTSPGSYTMQTSNETAIGGQPHEVVIDGLAPNTRYYYRMRYHAPGDAMDDWVVRGEYSFHTQRSPGSTFVFTIISDTHAEYTDAEYQQAIQNVIADQPDFHLDLGDTFMTDNDGSQSEVNDAYLVPRNSLYMGGIGRSAPIFLASGNHENEEGWNLDDAPFSPALASIQARKAYYPTPITDGFYSGNDDLLTDIDAATYGDQYREDYYAWEWGDALFVVFDPFQYTMNNPYGNSAGEGQVGENDPATGDRWNWTLGEQQFNWLKQTLEGSTAKFKFVFAHHMVGGSQNYVRGGAGPAHMFEWGGYNADGTTWGFGTERPGWGDDPIHQLMVDNNVSAFFHGHDHQYAYEVRDGVVYQCLPKPSPGLDFNYYSESDPYTERVIGNSGHIRVTVSPTGATVEYVRSNMTGVSHSYTIGASSDNTPPVADDQAVSTDEDTPVAITLTGSDVDEDALTFGVVDGPTNGVLSGSGANLTYTPDADYNGTDSFTFQANDGQADSNVATVSITVNPVNDAPVADDQAVSTQEDTPVAITLTGSDVDEDTLTFGVVDGPTNGVLSGSGANLTYTPNAGYTGSDSFTFRANDGTADSNLATVSISVMGGNYALSFDGSNDIVRAGQVPGTGPLTIEAWVRPDEDNADGLMIVGTDDTAGWSLELNGGQLTFWLYTNQGWQFVRHSTELQAGQWYHVAATYESGTARVFVDGVASTGASVGTLTQGPTLSIGGYGSYPFFAGTIDEVRISDVVRYSSDFVPSNEPFSSDANTLGLWHFDEGAGQTAADASTLANDGTLGSTVNADTADPTWVDGYVTSGPPDNNPPNAMDDSATTDEDTAVIIDVLANDGDVDGDDLTVSSITQPANGSAVNNGSDVTYTPDADYCGSDSFTYTVGDGNGGSDTATVDVSVTCVNDAPVADDQAVSTQESTPVDITLTGSDVDEDTLTFGVVDGPTNGVLSGGGANLTYTPNAGYIGSDSFTFRANDGTADSNLATVTIEITEVNTPPVADDQAVSTDEDTPVDITLTGSDVDEDALTFGVVDGPTNGVLSGSGANLTYTPDADYNGTDSFTFRANDGQADSNVATVSITVNPVNDAPVADDQAVSTQEGTPVAITLTGSDVDEDTLTFGVVDGPTNGVLSGSGANLTYTPNAGYTGSDSFTFRANDGTADSNLATVSVTVSPAGPIGQLEFGSVTVGGDYVTVDLDNTYVSPVVVCSVQYNNSTTPVVARVSNVTPTTFDVRLQNPSGGGVAAENVSYVVVEEGTWTIDGVKVEAQTYPSTVTDEDGSWVGEPQSYGQSYTNPVVLGQVMSENDSDWSVFWCQGGSRTDPPSAAALTTGKMVGEDTDTTRADETIGFIVFEAGHGTINGVEFEAALGSDTVQGAGDSPPYVYGFNTPFASAPEVVLTTLAGVDGANGGWAQVHGSTLATTTELYLSIDEDQIGDSERNHINEQVGYVAFGSSASPGPTIAIAGTPLSDFSSEPGMPSTEQNYTVSGGNLMDDITITAPSDFEISLTSGSGFGPSLTLSQSGGSVAETTIYVRFNRATEGTSTGNITHASTDATTRYVAVSGTAAPLAPVSFNILLGRPTDKSVTANIIPDQDVEFYIEYGPSSGSYSGQTDTFSATADEPIEIVIGGLSANTEYFYRVVYRQTGTTGWNEGAEYSFDTQKASGSTFTFTIIADSHLGQYGGQTADELALYEQTVLNVGADQPDFHIDLGDTFAMDPQPLGTGMTEAEAETAYLVQRPYMGLIGNSVPIYLAIGNHENEEGWNFDDTFTPPDQSLAIMGLKYRKMYYPNPIPDDFYAGNVDPLPEAIGGDTYREDYYAWEWGDALFVVLDPFHYSMTWPNEDGSGYGGEGQDGEPSGDRWDWTLGIDQYLWLKDTLENSDATYKFVFSHHVTGGSTSYGRGGIEAAPYFEWGGYNADGTWGWDTERPASEGWDVPIHQLFIDSGVDAFIHGHDHIYAYEELDGIVYLECPKPDDAGYAWEPYGYGYTEGLYPNGLLIPNSGHIRVTVSPTEATFEYVRSYLPGDGLNGEVAHSFTILADSDNTPPEAGDDSATTDEDTAVIIDVLANDGDVDGDSLVVSSVTQPANGSAVNNGSDVTYTPDADYCGSDSFTYTVGDGNGGSDTATVDVSVTCVNDAPVADDQAVSTQEGTPVAITLTGSDVDEDTLTFGVVDGPTNGVLSGGGANLTYTPNAGYIGSDSFTFRANDGTADSNLATVSISVMGGNYALSFDGSNDIVRAGQVPGTGPLTIEAWVRPDEDNADGLMIVGTDDTAGWSLELNGGQLTFWLYTNQGWQFVRHSTELQAGQWYHVAATYESGTARVFVDGVASTGASVGTLTQGPTLSIGGYGSYPFFAGTIDEVRISDVVRYSSDFVPSNEPFSSDANTLGLWHFDEGAGQTAADASTLANDGTLGSTGNADTADPTWVDGYPW
jgi:phosphodiesterase/alkaline phosphatase D-like protein